MPATFEGFSLSHAAILGADGVEEEFGDVYGVNEASIEVDTDSYDNTGDDFVLSSWFWFNFADVTVQAGYVPFETIALLSGADMLSSGAGETATYEVPMWTASSLNQPTRSMLVRVPSKDIAGNVRNLDIILYRVQFQPFGFDGPTYKDGLKLNYSGRAVISAVDETGAELEEPCIGRLVSSPISND